jgi:hypothetical protein
MPGFRKRLELRSDNAIDQTGALTRRKATVSRSFWLFHRASRTRQRFFLDLEICDAFVETESFATLPLLINLFQLLEGVFFELKKTAMVDDVNIRCPTYATGGFCPFLRFKRDV